MPGGALIMCTIPTKRLSTPVHQGFQLAPQAPGIYASLGSWTGRWRWAARGPAPTPTFRARLALACLLARAPPLPRDESEARVSHADEAALRRSTAREVIRLRVTHPSKLMRAADRVLRLEARRLVPAPPRRLGRDPRHPQ